MLILRNVCVAILGLRVKGLKCPRVNGSCSEQLGAIGRQILTDIGGALSGQ